MVRARTLAALGVLAGGAWAAGSAVRSWWHDWGVDVRELLARMPGDDLVPDAQAIETRGIDIGAPPDDVWPWLAQLGTGRGGWYTWDALDGPGGSPRRLLPEWQVLEVGDVVPTGRPGGFVVRGCEPGRSLVLYTSAVLADEELRRAHPGQRVVDGATGGARPAYAVSWAFLLVRTSTGTRLIERVRARVTADGPVQPMTLSPMAFGVFLALRRHLLGVRERAELLATHRAAAEAEVAPTESWVVAPEPLVAAPA